MKIKTSVTISENLIREIDSFVNDSGKRSSFIEDAIVAFLESKKRLVRNQSDLKLINKNKKLLNKEASDILFYQK